MDDYIWPMGSKDCIITYECLFSFLPLVWFWWTHLYAHRLVFAQKLWDNVRHTCNILVRNVTDVYYRHDEMPEAQVPRGFKPCMRRSRRSPVGSCPPTPRNELRLPIPGHITVPWPSWVPLMVCRPFAWEHQEVIECIWMYMVYQHPISNPIWWTCSISSGSWLIGWRQVVLTMSSYSHHLAPLTILRRISAPCWKAPRGLGEACLLIPTCTRWVCPSKLITWFRDIQGQTHDPCRSHCWCFGTDGLSSRRKTLRAGILPFSSPC